MLAAFAENALPAPERTFLLQHLSQCFDCRELLALSLPAIPAAVQSVHSPASSWLRWPVLRWAAAGACVVVVGAAVTLHYQEHPAARVMVSETTQVASPAVPAPDRQANAAAGQAAVENQPKSSPVMARRDDSLASLEKDSRVARRAAETMNSPAAAPQTVLAEAAPPRENTLPEASKKESQSKALDEAGTGQLASPEADSSNEVAELQPGKAKPASQDAMVAKTAPAAPAEAVSAPVATFGALIAPRWTLADGSLQRSLDGGKTWSASAVGSSANLRALSALGAEIWVGGTNGALYHSSDSGDHWTQVLPASKGQSLTADIIGVEFTDSRHGKLTTADQHTWTTSDDGQTWKVR
jgi:hypothetical protein